MILAANDNMTDQGLPNIRELIAARATMIELYNEAWSFAQKAGDFNDYEKSKRYAESVMVCIRVLDYTIDDGPEAA